MNRGEFFQCRTGHQATREMPAAKDQVGVEIEVTGTGKKQGPGGRQNGYSFEVLGDAEKYTLFSRRTIRIQLEADNKGITIEYSAQVVDAPRELRNAFGVRRCWDYEQVLAVPNSTSGNWAQGGNDRRHPNHQRRQPLQQLSPVTRLAYVFRFNPRLRRKRSTSTAIGSLSSMPASPTCPTTQNGRLERQRPGTLNRLCGETARSETV